ncbi:WD40 repeat domain-containing protein [Euhalothece natronophila Z-M001]|uniref:WD40 repeat domain-containing protein n=1 Tax=Euhalothece natronophila Z-M001 TaxID=522448 RepID=A0A5B8NP77_9CHRO|nr:WD40 repeat domain-containing protein [Euhalothece natronophila]QDZ39990.1 WD40 repeat domain-containing protein [Euhalothece natronophila Z-M001]
MKSRIAFQPTWEKHLSDYITAVKWSKTGDYLAVSSAAGEVILFRGERLEQVLLQSPTGFSVDCLEFSHDDQFLACGGQSGTVTIWNLSTDFPQCVSNLEYPSTWIDHLTWNPVNNELVFSLGKYAQVWDAKSQEIITTLNFASSSVMDLDWRNDGLWLAVGGYKATQVWNCRDWDDDPEIVEVPSASTTVKWSPDCRYLACGDIDSTLVVTEWGNPTPWLMQGFTGKVRQLAWSAFPTRSGAPLLAAGSGCDIVVWQRSKNENVGWSDEVVSHESSISAIAFHPKTVTLASVAKDGKVNLWHRGQKLLQSLDGAFNAFTCLHWHPKGSHLVAGGEDGEIILWSNSQRHS